MTINLAEKKQAKLEQQLNRRIAWWSMKRWRDVIYIPSQPKSASLLTCDVNCLTSVRLFNLTPAQLQEKIQTYRKKPAWRRWLQRCFSPIAQQIEALSLYEECFDFRYSDLSEQKLAVERSAIAEQPSEIPPSVVTAVSTAQTCEEEKIEETIQTWINRSRENLKNILLQNKHEKAFTADDFFEQSLKEFHNIFIEPLLQSIDYAQQDKEEKQELLKKLFEFYKKGLLFFHPDKSQDLINQDDTGELKLSFDNIFDKFKKSCDDTKNLLINKHKSTREEISFHEKIISLYKAAREQDEWIQKQTQVDIKKMEQYLEQRDKKLATLEATGLALRQSFLKEYPHAFPREQRQTCSLTEESNVRESGVNLSHN